MSKRRQTDSTNSLPSMRVHYSISLQIFEEFTRNYGFTFDTLPEVWRAAKEWALEEWGKGNFKKTFNGYQKNDRE